MARHLVAVCVVCLLCAEHFPCKGHIEGNENNKENLIKYSKDSRAEYLAHINNDNVENRASDIGNVGTHVKNKSQREIVRLKRHTHHQHHEPTSNSESIEGNLNIASSSMKYLGKIFSKYGKSESSQVMTLANFDELLTKLDLKKLVIEPKEHHNEKIVESNVEDTVSDVYLRCCE